MTTIGHTNAIDGPLPVRSGRGTISLARTIAALLRLVRPRDARRRQTADDVPDLTGTGEVELAHLAGRRRPDPVDVRWQLVLTRSGRHLR
jgi:hypothetical protein